MYSFVSIVIHLTTNTAGSHHPQISGCEFRSGSSILGEGGGKGANGGAQLRDMGEHCKGVSRS